MAKAGKILMLAAIVTLQLLCCGACSLRSEPKNYKDEYEAILQLLQMEQYQDALSLLEELDEYDDSVTLKKYAQMMLNIQQAEIEELAHQEQKYMDALAAYSAGDYDTARQLLLELEHYSNSTTLLFEIRVESITALLEGKLAYLDTAAGGARVTIWDQTVIPGNPCRYTLVDFDGDDINELVIEYDYAGDLLILHEMDGLYRGYHRNLRSMLDLKENGTYMYTNSAYASGVGSGFFMEWTMQDVWLLECDTQINSWLLHGADGTMEVTKDAYSAGMQVFYDTPNAVWTDLENTNKK